MKRTIWFLIVIAIAAAVAFAIVHNPGFVAVQLGNWLVGLPLWLFIVVWGVSFVVIAFLYKLAKGVFGAPGRFSELWQGRRLRKQKKLWTLAIDHWLTQSWREAEKTFKALASSKFVPAYSWLLAGMAAEKDARYGDALEALHQAKQLSRDKDNLPLTLLTVNALLGESKISKARQALAQAEAQAPKHPAVLKLGLTVERQQGCWDSALSYVSKLKKALPLTQWQSLYIEVVTDALHKSKRQTEIEAIWQKIPDDLQKEPSVLVAYAQRTQAFGHADRLLDLLKAALNQAWDATLFEWYCALKGSNIHEQLENAEKWAKSQPSTAELNRALGVLCNHANLLGRAKHYFEEGLKAEPNSPKMLNAYAEYFVQKGDYQTACEYYAKAAT